MTGPKNPWHDSQENLSEIFWLANKIIDKGYNARVFH